MGTNNNSINNIEVDFVKFYLFLRDDVGVDMEIEDAKEAYASINEEGYYKIDGYYLYSNEEVMDDLAEDELNTKLLDSNEVASMFNIEALAEMWIDNTSKEKIAREYLSDNGWQDVLECEEPKKGYSDSYGKTIYYAYSGVE